jgi:hypothetical protein
VVFSFFAYFRPILFYSRQDVWAFSKTNVNSVVFNPRYARHAVALADLFAARFDPEAPLPEARYQVFHTTV